MFRKARLDLMILTILTREPLHGYGISQRLAALSHDNFHVNPGSLFPSLYRLEQDGKLKAEWRPSENNRNAKYYRLTASGRRAAGAGETALGPRRVRHHERVGGRMTLLHRLASVLGWLVHRKQGRAETGRRASRIPRNLRGRESARRAPARTRAPPGDSRARRHRAGQGTRPHVSPRRVARRGRTRRAVCRPPGRRETPASPASSC